MTDGSCHPMDDNYGAVSPSWLCESTANSKIALKSEHYPKQGKVTTDLAQAKYDLEQRQMEWELLTHGRLLIIKYMQLERFIDKKSDAYVFSSLVRVLNTIPYNSKNI